MQEQKNFQLVRINPSGGAAGHHQTISIEVAKDFQLVRINPSGGVKGCEMIGTDYKDFQLVRINPSGGGKHSGLITQSTQ